MRDPRYRKERVKLTYLFGPQIGMNPKPILGLPNLETNSGSPRLLVFFLVTHKIGLFSPKIEAIRIARHCLYFVVVLSSLLALSSSIPFLSLLRRRPRSRQQRRQR